MRKIRCITHNHTISSIHRRIGINIVDGAVYAFYNLK